MNWRDVIFLRVEEDDTNEYGDPTITVTEDIRFANKMDIFASEFYQAQGTDLKPDVKFKLRFNEYQGQQSFRYESIVYKVIRTYNPDDEFIELTGQALQNEY